MSWNCEAKASIFSELGDVLKSEEVLLTIIWTYFSNYPVFLKKIEAKFGLISVISSSDFQTSSTLLIFFVLGFWIINEHLLFIFGSINKIMAYTVIIWYAFHNSPLIHIMVSHCKVYVRNGPFQISLICRHACYYLPL